MGAEITTVFVLTEVLDLFTKRVIVGNKQNIEFRLVKSMGSKITVVVRHSRCDRILECCTSMSCYRWHDMFSNGFARIFKATTVLAPSTLDFQVLLQQSKSTCAKGFSNL